MSDIFDSVPSHDDSIKQNFNNFITKIYLIMKILHFITVSVFLVFAVQSAAVAQSINLTETFKKSF